MNYEDYIKEQIFSKDFELLSFWNSENVYGFKICPKTFMDALSPSGFAKIEPPAQFVKRRGDCGKHYQSCSLGNLITFVPVPMSFFSKNLTKASFKKSLFLKTAFT
jgi:hypothetical protein